MEILFLAAIGIVLGISAAIPGVSLGTMAVSLNVYDRLIDIITPDIKKIFAAWKFWVPLLIGIGAGIVLFSKLAGYLFNNYEVPTYWFFIGLITGSIPLVYKKMKPETSILPSVSSIICTVIALAAIIAFAMVNTAETESVYTELDFKLAVLLLLGGVLSALAMIVPGISGSFMLLVAGLYRTVIQAVSDFNLPLLGMVVLGIIIGLFGGAAGIRFLLAKVPKATYGAVFGLVLGSIIILLKIPESAFVLVLSILTFAIGFVLSFFTGRKSF